MLGVRRKGRDVKKDSRQAFTLIELLAVIGIIVVLVTLVLAGIGRARGHARLTKCRNNMRQILTALQLYGQDHAGPNASDPKPGLLPVAADFTMVTGNRAKYEGQACGLGTLVEEDYLASFDDIWCPAIAPPNEYEEERERWESSPGAGCGYFYLWLQTDAERFTLPEGDRIGNFTRERGSIDSAERRGWHAVIMDIDVDAEIDGVPYRSHPAVRRINIGFLSGGVRTVAYDERLLLASPDDYGEWMSMWAYAHTLGR